METLPEARNHKVTVAIPAKDEDKTIEEIIHSVRPYAHEVMVIDGHSVDGTVEIAQRAGARVELDDGRGKGGAVRLAIRKAEGDILVFIDADGSHSPDDIPRLVQPIAEGRAHMVIGSRMLGGSDESHDGISHFIRTVGSGIITLFINYRWGSRITDCENGFRAIEKRTALDLDLKAHGFEIEQEMVMKCLRKGYIIDEVPSHEYTRKWGASRVAVWKVWHKFLWSLVKHLF